MTETEENSKQKKFRSPNYPFIGLKEALKKATVLKEKGGLFEVPFRSAMELWKYKVGSTSQTIAALKAFGLITVTGEGESRKMKVTDVARKILGEHPERPQLLKEAAVKPPVYQDLWRQFGGGVLPADSIIANYLEYDRKFNPEVIKGVISDFRDTITFANLSTSDKIASTDVDSEEVNTPVNTSETNNQDKDDIEQNKKASVLKGGVMYSINIELLEDGQINIATSDGSLTSKMLKLLTEVFELKERYETKPEKQADLDSVLAAMADGTIK
ncbi:MAG TPA: hypothetical protein VK612_03685 [Pyrinomonadaceae bacterium]|nr:hypothetical protein [Pyrinomonadaceae bacterium]